MVRGHLLNTLNTPCSRSWYWPLSSITTNDVGGIGLKKPSIIASLSWNTCLLWISESHVEQKNWHPDGTHSRHRTTASTALHHWQQCWVTVSADSMQFKISGNAALKNFSDMTCLLVHTDMMGASSISSDAETVTELSRLFNLWRCWSTKK